MSRVGDGAFTDHVVRGCPGIAQVVAQRLYAGEKTVEHGCDGLRANCGWLIPEAQLRVIGQKSQEFPGVFGIDGAEQRGCLCGVCHVSVPYFLVTAGGQASRRAASREAASRMPCSDAAAIVS